MAKAKKEIVYIRVKEKVPRQVVASYLKSYNTGSCVFKAWIGRKYLVWRCKTLTQAVTNLVDQIDRMIRQGNIKQHDATYGAAQEMIDTGARNFVVEVVFESTNSSELLIKELQLLQDGKKDPACLNVIFEPIVPKWMQEEDLTAYHDYLTKNSK